MEELRSASTISVVIPCYNEEKYIGKLLNNLSIQTKNPDQIIVADCSSEDKTIDVIKAFQRLPVKIVNSAYRSTAAARNAGAKAATGDYLLFVDADIKLPMNLIKEIHVTIKSRNVDFVTPSYKSDGKQIVDSYLIWLINNLMFINLWLLKRLWAIGGVMVVRKLTHDNIGGFNQTLVIGDDLDYSRRLRKIDASFVYLKKIKVIHSSRRFQGYGTRKALVAIITENSKLGKWFFQPLFRKMGRGRKYGHYR